MKIAELNKRIMAGEAVLTGKFLGSKMGKSVKTGTESETVRVSGPSKNHEFQFWGQKGAAPLSLKPRYDQFKDGQLVAVLGFNCEVRDKYLRAECTEIVLIEP